MVKGLSKFIKIIHFVGDVFLLNMAFLIAYFLKFNQNPFSKLDDHYVFLFIVFNCIWVVLVLLLKLYEIHRVSRIESVLINAGKSILLHALLLFGLIVSMNAFYFSRKH